ncbi:MAG: archaeal proteasome endopeptidase complex subunit alpha [Nitrosopumilus sp.]|nr:archaeal proteasome endopeptidase complex subunit alpha [Nitrosopumilus sp.]CAI9830904.1 Proteasome subunit alpha 2 [Nitrosopumilaceae archaeon]MDA7941315.1 archaeal proteasome endopeptidase complex subunit alpha [Nitrosopumilus sp.]MDA7942726.1 archaeal proteasome endopeptidase complex subunit alpha [Nitrosopumilus sp.]MDA7945288.1 archaeal proteasome endopeptidase complex subunit alpha [Nitrosopumilus sp.]
MMASRGYDMTPTMYSPDGRIYQVEYAMETVKRGTLAIGLRTEGGVIMAVEEKPRALQTTDITQKIFQVDFHIGVAAAGYIPDARVQVDNARYFSQGTRMTYDEPAEVATVARHLADQSHQFTQYSGVRPNGVSLIIAGIDQKGGSIYVTDPSGTYVQYAAVAIGASSDDVNHFLEKHYDPGMGMEDAASLAIAAINLKAEQKGGTDHVKMARVPSGSGAFEKVPGDELASYSGGASKFQD